ncbi:UNVERIFIED_CONTAM: Retrovirus-related Pol polyprotein from transposon TNT 1-94 [Sesamum latifolium]|uniref:Retrovirus-related Pol polyprotein from transposon TNT 1-94 n=1 Tax=Sesamum latifolium TaxID=2727402 RepID=A0AAW2X6H6_9LAMI
MMLSSMKKACGIGKLKKKKLNHFLPYFGEEQDDMQPDQNATPAPSQPPSPTLEESSNSDPLTFDEAMQDKRWRKAMDEDKSIEKNNTWELSSLPKDHKAIGVKWVYKVKKNAQGMVEKFKARLVVKGYKQKHGVDYDEVFAPVARMETIRLLIALAAQIKWNIYQLDVKSTFLNGYLEEEVYVKQPLGYVINGHEDKVLKLKKGLYGLKQAPRAWNNRIDKYFQGNGFVRCLNEYALYIKIHDNGDILLVCLYVDDLIFTGNNPSLFENFKKEMSLEFDMTDLCLMPYYLGLEVKQSKEGIFLSQAGYAKEVLKKFNMFDCNSVNTPMVTGLKLSKFGDEEKVNPTLFKSLVGSLRYLTCTRPDILFAVGVISRFMEAPISSHMKAAKRILRYLKGTLDFGIFYSRSNDFTLKGFCDSDFAGDIDDRKSTTGFVFFMGDCVISRCSKKQPIVTLSTCESEYVAATSCTCLFGLEKLLKELHLSQEKGQKFASTTDQHKLLLKIQCSMTKAST